MRRPDCMSRRNSDDDDDETELLAVAVDADTLRCVEAEADAADDDEAAGWVAACGGKVLGPLPLPTPPPPVPPLPLPLSSTLLVLEGVASGDVVGVRPTNAEVCSRVLIASRGQVAAAAMAPAPAPESR